MRRNIAALLRYHDYEPIEAEDGRTGSEAARREKPHLVSCDLIMHELNRHGVLQTLRLEANLCEAFPEGGVMGLSAQHPNRSTGGSSRVPSDTPAADHAIARACIA